MKTGIHLKYMNNETGMKISVTIPESSCVTDALDAYKGFLQAIGYQVEGYLEFTDEVDDFYTNVYQSTVKELEAQIEDLTAKLEKAQNKPVSNMNEIHEFLDRLDIEDNLQKKLDNAGSKEACCGGHCHG